MKENIILYTCDICKRIFNVTENEKIPLRDLHLPMNYYNETGFDRVTVEKVEACDDCITQMAEDLSEHYDMSSRWYVGLNVSRKGGAE